MLSNLLWWPWHGIGAEEPPVEGPPIQMGDRRVHHERIRRHPPDEDDVEAFITVLLDSL